LLKHATNHTQTRYLQAEMTNAKTNIVTPFNEEFCTRLEYRLCKEFAESNDTELKYYWCDGVSWFPTDNQLTKKYVNDNRKIITKAWIGKDGQDVYQASINFGPRALSKYSKGADLTNTIPELESKSEWIEIDIMKRTINIFLK
jgi:hypothetical protein